MVYILYFVVVALILYALLLLFIFMNVRINVKWFSTPSSEGKFVDSNGKKIFYRVKGKGEPAIVVINAVGSSQAEWWPIQNEVGLQYRIITFDRPGYNWSGPSEASPIAPDVSEIIDLIIKFERIKRPIILVANGTGAVYAQHYASTRPQNTAAALFIDPLPMQYELWCQTVNDNEDCKSTLELTIQKKQLAKRGYFRVFSPYKGYHLDKRFKKEIIEFFSRSENYETMEKEWADLEKSLAALQETTFPPIPLKLLSPANESLIREWMRNGMTEYAARQLGRLHHELIADYMKLSPKATFTEIESSGEHIHLSKPDIVVEKILELVNEV
ncbi:MAG: alpha/beta hydrolase [Clostridia bacterium]|nr:alpha/beta hydrolase [Clostridia bacterium]